MDRDIICAMRYTVANNECVITVCEDGVNHKPFGDPLGLEDGLFTYHDIYHVLFRKWCNYSMVYDWLFNGAERHTVPFLDEEAVIIDDIHNMPMEMLYELFMTDHPGQCTHETFVRAMQAGRQAMHEIAHYCEVYGYVEVHITTTTVICQVQA